MYKIVTGTQYEPEVKSLFHAKFKIIDEDLHNILDKKLIHVYYNDTLVMVSDDGEFNDIGEDDRRYYGKLQAIT